MTQTFSQPWEEETSKIKYPFVDTASFITTVGNYTLPTDFVLDANITIPDAIENVRLSSISVFVDRVVVSITSSFNIFTCEINGEGTFGIYNSGNLYGLLEIGVGYYKVLKWPIKVYEFNFSHIFTPKVFNGVVSKSTSALIVNNERFTGDIIFVLSPAVSSSEATPNNIVLDVVGDNYLERDQLYVTLTSEQLLSPPITSINSNTDRVYNISFGNSTSSNGYSRLTVEIEDENTIVIRDIVE